MGKPLVIVESPAKARTIEKFLGAGYQVAASVGHIRDLPETAADIPKEFKDKKWARTAVDVENNFAPLYVLTERGREQVKTLKKMLSDADALYLATDEDREGEAIAWHLFEVLKPKVPVKRLVFHEITDRAIKEALASPRALNLDLVRAQETRRIIDRLYGYNVSPVLWKKIKPRLSAGRVQSVAVRLIVDRERSRMRFVPGAWWDLNATFDAQAGRWAAQLVELNDKRVASGRDFEATTGALKPGADLVLLNAETAASLRERLLQGAAKVHKVQRKPFTERPYPPFTTSTLQQEANRKFKWPARRTMSVAQRLYETGWITYMRTDSLHLSEQAISAARGLIKSQFGPDYVPNQPRMYKTSAKGAQEAHEAIRPAGDVFRSITSCRAELGDEEARLYELIWKRTMACQMEDARGERVTVDTLTTTAAGERALFRANGRTFSFAGYRRVYVEDLDEGAFDLSDSDTLLPPLKEGDAAKAVEVGASSHETSPPARLTDASLVKELESLGIGRPSTYASIIETILSRGYVFKKGTSLVPTWTAFAVTQLMETHFQELVDYTFTATMEDGLDSIALGQETPLRYLSSFYHGHDANKPNSGLTEQIRAAEAAADPRVVCSIPLGTVDGVPVVARVGRFGPYIELEDKTRSLPDELPPDEMTAAAAAAFVRSAPAGPTKLGDDPATGLAVMLFNGRFGPYVQLGETSDDDKPKRQSLPKELTPAECTLQDAIALLALPRNLGKSASDDDILVFNGRFGPFVRAGKEVRNIPPGVSLLTISREQALELLSAPASRARGAAAASNLAELGESPEGRRVVVKKGRFGAYVTDGVVNATLKRGVTVEELSLADALILLNERRDAPPSTKSRGRGAPRRGAPKAAAAPKATAKKAVAKKAVAKKAVAAEASEEAPKPTKKAVAKKATPKKATTKKAPSAAAKAAEAAPEAKPTKKTAAKAAAKAAEAPSEAKPAEKATAKKASGAKKPPKKATAKKAAPKKAAPEAAPAVAEAPAAPAKPKTVTRKASPKAPAEA
ncbi:MAG: type I DNA topoisomerase [Deltaproteobacteria bacterium]|nr:type I DNA topoisomerase [Deltaproteobacteria bacterium]